MQMSQNQNFVNPYSSMSQMPNYQASNNIAGSNPNFQNIPMQNNARVQPSFLPGRIVRSENDVIPNEVPMDGNIGVFLQQDFQRVYAKTWGGDGRIHTNTYELVNPNQQNSESKDDQMSLILERLDRIEETLKRDKPRYYSNSRPSKKSYSNPNRVESGKENVREEN